MNSSRPLKSCGVSDSFLHLLNGYALAATAAGFGVLCLTDSAAARIVYKHANEPITPNNTSPLDINNDGKTDFNFHDSFTCTSFCEYIVGAITVEPVKSANQVVGYQGRSHQFASALTRGFRIGPKAPFLKGNPVMALGGYDAGTNTVGYCSGPWNNVKHHYLGLKFAISGKIHYGWARLNETCAKNGENTATITGYAYETTPNKPIIAGRTKGKGVVTVQPASLGHLAAAGSWR